MLERLGSVADPEFTSPHKDVLGSEDSVACVIKPEEAIYSDQFVDW